MFGMGFTEILIIAVIAILFLGPDKLPSAMVDIAKFFRQMKKTVGTVKDSLEEEMNVSEIKQEALAYKKQLLDAQDEVEKITKMPDIGAKLTDLSDDLIGDIDNTSPKEEEVTFKKKKKTTKIEKEDTDV
ncbi:MAG: sec-independent protein translocase protein TatB [Sulfurimonas sp.]|jgi:sec-independent protein translocase protein TatB|uniref:Sec-independent protein translocase protein TatB n=1 Tax=Sulfurimonas sp. TaxID=2022749 RepID=UPI0039E453BD